MQKLKIQKSIKLQILLGLIFTSICSFTSCLYITPVLAKGHHHRGGGAFVSPIVGKYNWSDGTTVEVQADRGLSSSDGAVGNWRLDANGQYIFTWIRSQKLFTDILILSSDGKTLIRNDQSGSIIGTKITVTPTDSQNYIPYYSK